MIKLIKKIISIIPSKLKKETIFFLIINFTTVALEMIGLFLIIPLISIILSPELLGKNFLLDFLYLSLEKPTQNQMLIIVSSIIIIIFLVKNLLLSYFIWWQINYAHKIQLVLSTSIFQNYIYKDYLFHVANNSAKLIRNSGLEPGNIRTAILGVMTLFTESLLIIGLVSVLIFYNPIINSLVVSIFLIFSISFYFFIRKRITKWGTERLLQSGIKQKALNQAFQGIKDIKVYNVEKFFINFFHKSLSKLLRMNILNGMVKSLPRLLIEFLGVFVLVVLVGILFSSENFSTDEIITSLSLFALGIIKILPSVSKILGAVQSVKYMQPSVEFVYNEFKTENFLNKNYNSTNDKNVNFFINSENNLIINNVSFNYTTGPKRLNDVTLDIRENEIFGIIGESGSGKSTLINLILGLLKPNSGNIQINKIDIHENIKSWQKNIGLIPQHIYLTDDTIINNIGFGLDINDIDIKRVEKCIELAELTSFINNLSDGLNTLVGERGVKISGGELQRIGIARALYKDPKILILDEATSALDINTEKNILETISSLKTDKIIIIVSHRKSIFEFCKKIYEIKKGCVREN